MSDLFCVICGEPCEDYYVYHEMTSSERERFLSGKGCECCKGKKPEGRTESDQFTSIAHNLMESEDPDTILNKLGLV